MATQISRVVTLTCLVLLCAARLAIGQQVVQRSGAFDTPGTVEYTFAVDPTMQLRVSVLMGFSRTNPAFVTPTVIDPSGVVVVPGPGVIIEGTGVFGGSTQTTYFIQSPLPGMWKVVLEATRSVHVSYLFTVQVFNASLTLAAAAAPTVVVPNVPVTVTGQLQRGGGAAQTGAAVKASVAAPSGAVTTLRLADDGAGPDAAADDGIYTGVLVATSEEGSYVVTLEASGADDAGRAFQRQTTGSIERTLSFAVNAAPGEILEGITDFIGFSDTGRGPGVVLDVPVRLPVTGLYRLSGYLSDVLGNLAFGETSDPVFLTAGDTRIQFAVTDFASSGFSNGPYVVTNIKLALVDPASFRESIVALVTTPYLTQPYSILDMSPSAGGPGTPKLALRDPSIASLGNGRYLWSSRLTNIGTGLIRTVVVKQFVARLSPAQADHVTDVAFAVGTFPLFSGFPVSLAPNQSVPLSAVLTIPAGAPRVTFTASGLVADPRGEVLSFAVGQAVIVP
jgi:hypothetical protein